jgi:single-strand DNA-binding protein
MYGRIEAAFIGTIGRDAELKTSRNGTPLVNVPVAVAQREDDEPQWVTCAVFGEQATDLAHRLTKGSKAYFEGNLKLSHWRTKDGEQRIGLDLAAHTCQPIGQIGRKKAKRLESDTAAHTAANFSERCHTPLDDEIPL